ncbi:MAG: cytochrome c-type biogenesis protein CcmH [Acidobacteria bacterium]|nr:cytochrome c-type biogenesis protein CcmH [Acidobacteriota bacterium]
MKHCALRLVVVFLVSLTVMGAGNDLEQRFQSLGHKMVCVCGCTQILLECNHVGCPDSSRMITELHTQLASGGGDTSIFNWFSAKYGPTVLAAPIRGGFDTVAWVVPFALSLLALIFTIWIVRRWKYRRPAHATSADIQMQIASDDIRERIRQETEY